ncbi:MAG: acyl-CoA dehydratase activase [Bacilli bacterium]|jgi:predicted CoA-substrate-specific enzyme activase|nr:acyl-CoA dehydratase activase [Bacilli bacterium]
MVSVGIDIGSTTIKAVVLDEKGNLLYSSYERHFSRISEKLGKVLSDLQNGPLKGMKNVPLAFTGSAGMGIAEGCHFPFYQEVYATRETTLKYFPKTDGIIELGGEDAKILFLTDGFEVRMNGTCAGGTGAFIDQMASLLNVKIEDMDKLAKSHERIYTIASRCGVFAKTDVQPLLNQGARKEDIAESIFYSVVNQTIAGLAQGREIGGNVLYLGGPLTFMSELRKAFDDTLKIKGTLPENSLYFVAIGAALLARKDKNVDLDSILSKVENYRNNENFAYIEPLFRNDEEYEAFRTRHDKDFVPVLPLDGYKGPLYLGVDSGSTTLKLVLVDKEKNIRYSDYQSNQGDPIALLQKMLLDIYGKLGEGAYIAGASATGYGEDLAKNAFSLDHGIVETMAHFKAAKHFLPDVQFIIDIGGQDIKCFRIKNGVVDDIFLNEACSSGCGSFLQTFARSLGYSIEDFSKMALLAKRPVNLGSRCTVFMNSSVKQAQKDGASVNDISAGLSISVVKNALYKVIRCSSPSQLGTKIVVQGGTFLNDAVLRAFEKELGVNVIRSNIAGLMGAYGAALDASSLKIEKSSILTKEALNNFHRKVSSVLCQGCQNHCRLSISLFDDHRVFIGGNRCEKPLKKKTRIDNTLDLYAFKNRLLRSYDDSFSDPSLYPMGKVGFPMGLSFYEMTPFWYTLFHDLGFQVILSDPSSSKLYRSGQMTIPSDTVCFPAKIMHGHVQNLIDKGVPFIFYPCQSYNIEEKNTANHYNCPVVAYYSEVIKANMKVLCKNHIQYFGDYVNISEKPYFGHKFYEDLKKFYPTLTEHAVRSASDHAYKAYKDYQELVFRKGMSIIDYAKKHHETILVLSGRPYHVDPLISHDIDKLILGYGCVVVSEDVVSRLDKKPEPSTVLNQWTYHSRLYKTACYVSTRKDMEMLQLVSFGCGVDAVTSDEVRDILERHGKIYTQLKIDEVTNLGAVKIRIRSLLEALKEKEETK